MDTGIKMLLKAERENWKKRMVKETKGTLLTLKTLGSIVPLPK